jgi:hypothetical protein
MPCVCMYPRTWDSRSPILRAGTLYSDPSVKVHACFLLRDPNEIRVRVPHDATGIGFDSCLRYLLTFPWFAREGTSE